MIPLRRFVVGIDARCGVHGSTGHFDLKLCSLGDPPSGSQGPVPLKWTGRPHATALMAANQVHVWPCLAALHRVHIQTPVVAPHACAWPLLSCPLATASQVCAHSVAVPRTTLLMAAKRVRVCPHSGDTRARTFMTAPLGCAHPSVAAPQVVAR